MTYNSNLYKNQLTNLPNFISFMLSDFKKNFGVQGIIVYFEVAALSYINRDYGHGVGDEVLMKTAEELKVFQSAQSSVELYHIGGDSFILICQSVHINELSDKIERLKENLLAKLKKYNIPYLKFHNNMVEYNEEIRSVEGFYQYLYNNPAEDGRYQSEFWVFDILRQFSKNIKHSLQGFEEANKQAHHDDISGLQNHRAAMQYFESIKMNRETDHEIFVLFIDGDELKRFNNISYSIGNDMIMKLASTLQNTLRSSDRIFRWLSGDEFVVVLENTNHENATLMAERLRETVEKTLIDLEYPVTVSIGVSKYNKESSVDEVINKAERANKYAKDNGKNIVVFWDEVK